jgi:hypothetical protein
MSMVVLSIGWFVWCFAAGAALLSWARLTSKAAVGERISVAEGAQLLSLTLLSVWFYLFPEWSKLHILWLAPMLAGAPIFFDITREAFRR